MKQDIMKRIGVLAIAFSLLSVGMVLTIPTISLGATGDSIQATRSIDPDTVDPGDTFQVQVVYTVHTYMTQELTLIEVVPTGWTVSPVSMPGGWMYYSAEVRWSYPGNTMNGQTGTIVYDVTVPGGAADGTYSLSGQVSALGLGPFAVTGETQVIVGEGGPPVNTPPTVTITAPADGATVSGSVSITGTAADTDGTVSLVQIRDNGGAWTTVTGTTSWSYTWDSTLVADGSHTLDARSYDGTDYSPVDSVTVTVGNGLGIEGTRSIDPDTVAPGGTFQVTVVVEANADLYGPALEETVPGGWTVTPVTTPTGWTFNPSTLQWVLLSSMTTGQTATIVYEVTVPGGAAEMTYSLSGQVSAFELGPFAVTGETSVTVVGGSPPSNTPPTVTITAPADGATVSGSVSITGTAGDVDGTVSLVQVRIDGGSWLTATGTASWTRSWATTGVSDGSHTVSARSYDGTDYSLVDSVTVTVNNGPAPTEYVTGMRSIDPDTVDPSDTFQVQVVIQVSTKIYTVSFTTLKESVPAGWTLTNVSMPVGWVYDGGGKWHFQGAMMGGQSATIVYAVTVPAGAADGTYSLSGQVSAFELGPYAVTGEAQVIVGEGGPPVNTPPTVTITAPADGATVSGSVSITGTAADTDGTVTLVQIRDNGGAWTTVTGTTSWSYTWDSTLVADGSHTLDARSYDGTDYSPVDSVTVTVNNGPVPTEYVTGMRSIDPDTVAPGGTFTVTVVLQANADLYGPALEETVPGGWTVTPVTTPAGWTFNPSTLQWVLLSSMTTGQTATIVYEVTVPGGAAEMTYSLSGQVSAYGVGPFAVTGETSVTVVGGSPPSNTPPTVTITAPADGATVSGSVSITGTAADTDGTVSLVQVRIDGGSWLTATGTTSWARSWATTGVSDGSHTVSARSYDGTDYSPVDSVTVTVNNGPAPTEYVTGMRSIDPDTVAPGGTFTVMVVVQANADVTAPALNETVPAGWTVTPVTTPAGWTFKSLTLEWILLSAMTTGQTATFVYEVTVPAGAAATTYSLSGQVSAFELGPFAVTGDSIITVIEDWNSWDDDDVMTTEELQEAINHWLNDIPKNGHLITTTELQAIIALWLTT